MRSRKGKQTSPPKTHFDKAPAARKKKHILLKYMHQNKPIKIPTIPINLALPRKISLHILRKATYSMQSSHPPFFPLSFPLRANLSAQSQSRTIFVHSTIHLSLFLSLFIYLFIYFHQSTKQPTPFHTSTPSYPLFCIHRSRWLALKIYMREGLSEPLF